MTFKSAALGALPLFLAVGCTSASFKNTWRNWGAPAVVMKKNRVVVLAVNMPRTTRLGVEAAATDELRHMGFRASAAYEIHPLSWSIESARAELQKEGFEAAIVFRATTSERELYPAPGRYEPRDLYLTYWGWGGGWISPPSVSDGGERKLFIETLVYSVRSDELMWSGISEPSDVSDFARDLVRIAISDMRNAGLIL